MRNKYGLFKAYVKLEESNYRQIIEEIFSQNSDSFLREYTDFAFNYKPMHAISRSDVLSVLNKLDFSDFESLELSKEKFFGFWVNRFNAGDGGRQNLFEMRCVFPYEKDDVFNRFVEIVQGLVSVVKPLYGYGRVLASDFDFATETKLKKKLFGGYKVVIRNPLKEWFESPAEIGSGSIKGVYRFNLLGLKAIGKSELLKKIDRQNIEVKISFGDDMEFWQLKESYLKELSSSCGDLGSFYRY